MISIYLLLELIFYIIKVGDITIDKILNAEKSLFKYEFISNVEYLESIFSDNFLECGKSGIIYDKNTVIESLLKATHDRDITIYNFTCENIDKNTWLVHYITLENDKLYYRTSIWLDNDIKLLYHQATLYNEKIELISY